jgi:hypothetical protein
MPIRTLLLIRLFLSDCFSRQHSAVGGPPARASPDTFLSVQAANGRSARRSRFAAWQNTPSAAGLTMPAPAGGAGRR